MKHYVGVYEIHHPSGRVEKFQVTRNVKNNVHFTSRRQAEIAAMRAGHIKLQQRNIPIGSSKVAYAEERNVVDTRRQTAFSGGFSLGRGKRKSLLGF